MGHLLFTCPNTYAVGSII